MTIGSLFTGIGGFDLGLERAGHRICWQVEYNTFRRAILRACWPDVPRSRDVQQVDFRALRSVAVLVGGFPCKDLSSAKTERKGLDGEQSSLWRSFRRAIDALGPTWVCIENVAMWRDWVPAVRRQLYARGYASVSFHVPAYLVGAPHQRDRVFVVAHTHRNGQPACAFHAEASRVPEFAAARWTDWGEPPPAALGVADGVPDRLDRLAACGDAVVPAVGAVIGDVLTAMHAQCEQ